MKYPFTDGTTFDGKDYRNCHDPAGNNVWGRSDVVNPNDERYQALIEARLVPLVDREVEIIADDYTPDFGTG